MTTLNINKESYTIDNDMQFIELVKMYMGDEASAYIKGIWDENEVYMEILELTNERLRYENEEYKSLFGGRINK